MYVCESLTRTTKQKKMKKQQVSSSFDMQSLEKTGFSAFKNRTVANKTQQQRKPDLKNEMTKNLRRKVKQQNHEMVSELNSYSMIDSDSRRSSGASKNYSKTNYRTYYYLILFEHIIPDILSKEDVNDEQESS